MKLTKKQWTMIVVGVIVVFLIYWFFFRKKKAESGYVAADLRGRSPKIKNAWFGKAVKCPEGCRFIPETAKGCICPEDLEEPKSTA